MLEALNNIGGIVQPFGLCRDKKNIPLEVAGVSMKLWVALFDHHQFH